MNWLVTKVESQSETVYTYHGVWIFYFILALGLLLSVLSIFPIPGADVIRIVGGALFALWFPFGIWYLVHFRSRYTKGASVSGSKLSRVDPPVLRIPKSAKDESSTA